MIQRIADALARLGRQRRSTWQRVGALVAGGAVFLVVFPGLLVLFGAWLSGWIAFDWPRALELVVAVLALVAGVLVAGWATVAQWRIGEGTPAPMAAAQHLVVRGPYRLCRNPILLGGVFYYLGVGALFESLTVGLLGFVVIAVVGGSYFKFIEEKELVLRFGDEYREYRERTPFLIPRFRRSVRRAPIERERER